MFRQLASNHNSIINLFAVSLKEKRFNYVLVIEFIAQGRFEVIAIKLLAYLYFGFY